MPILDNPRWEKFIQEMLTGKSQRQAYYVAYPSSKKWKPETVDKRASELYSKGVVLGRYKELQSMYLDKAIMSRKERMVTLSEIASDEEMNETARIKAIDTLNKMDGSSMEKVEVSGEVKRGNPYKQLTTAELRHLARDDDG